MVTLTEASRDLRRDRQYVKGYAEALGITLISVPPRTLLMSRRDLRRLERRLGKPEDAATTVPAPS